MDRTPQQIFGAGSASDFVGRKVELGRLLRHALGSGSSNGLVLLAAPSAGTSELLRQTYDRFFASQTDVIPFYFELHASDHSARNVAVRFLREFLLQTVAFRRREATMIDSSPEIGEIAELATAADGQWINRLAERYREGETVDAVRAFIRNCLSAPLRAAANGARSFVMIDDLHLAARLEDGETLLEDLEQIFSRASVPFVLAGQRRFLFSRTPYETMHVDRLSFSDVGKLIERLSAKTGVATNDQTRDLIAVQLDGNPRYINSLFASAADGGNGLDSFDRVERHYTNEIFGGRISRYLDAILDQIVPDGETQGRVLRLLAENLNAADGRIAVAYWKKHLGLAGADFDAVLDCLNWHEIVGLASGSVVTNAANIVIADYIRGRMRLERAGDPRALAVGETLTKNIKRAPQIMARFYRQISAIGLRGLMLSFDGRSVSPALIDYDKFKNQFKGADDDKILKALKEDNEKIVLPQIIYTAHTAAFYPRLNELYEAERSAVAIGFTDSTETDEVVWIAAEIDSKLEATRDVTEFWCDRLEMVGLSSNFSRFKLWLVAPEGFAPDAVEVLRARNAYGSSRKQVDLMTAILNPNIRPTAAKTATEYEIVIPMDDGTELIAAHTIEEIAKRHRFSTKEINQLKIAVIEACINAAEHSQSPDRKIYQKFAVDGDRITITVSNRGLRLADKKKRHPAQAEDGRGRGFKIINGVMDEVKMEQTDDGTRITMVKYLKTA